MDIEINQKAKNIKYNVFVIEKLKKILSLKNLITRMYGLYYSVATYGIIARGSAAKLVSCILKV